MHKTPVSCNHKEMSILDSILEVRRSIIVDGVVVVVVVF